MTLLVAHMVKNSIMFAQTISNKLFHLPTVKGRKKEKVNVRLTKRLKGNEMCTGPFEKLWSIPGDPKVQTFIH